MHRNELFVVIRVAILFIRVEKEEAFHARLAFEGPNACFSMFLARKLSKNSTASRSLRCIPERFLAKRGVFPP